MRASLFYLEKLSMPIGVPLRPLAGFDIVQLTELRGKRAQSSDLSRFQASLCGVRGFMRDVP